MRRTDKIIMWLGIPLPILLTAVGGTLISVGLYVALMGIAQKEAYRLFIKDATECVNGLKNRLEQCQRRVRSVKIFFESSQLVSRDEFLSYGHAITEDQYGLTALCWLPIVPKNQESYYELQARKEGLEHFQIHRLSCDPTEVVYESAPFLVPFYYVLPYRTNQELLGINAVDDPSLRGGFEQAVRKNAITAIFNSKIFDKQGYQQAIFIAPVYKVGALTATARHRQQAMQGYICGVFNLEKILLQSNEPYHNKINLQLILPNGSAVCTPGAEQSKTIPKYTWHQNINLADTEWRMICQAVVDYVLPYQRWGAVLALGLSVALTALLTMHLNSLYHRRHQTEAIIQRRTAELQKEKQRCQQLMAQAQAANEAKSQFLANMSHEIRTPMNSIIGFAELLAEDELTEQQRDFVITIRDNAKTLLGIINDILDLSKIEAGKLTIQPHRCDIRELIEKCADVIFWSAKKKGIEFRLTVSDNIPFTVYLDELRVRQCLLNVLNNAVKFTEKGYVGLYVNLDKTQDSGWLRFDIEDTGIGIPADRLEAIFAPFVQADGSTTRLYGGTGLGLTITKNLVEQMGGTLTVRSDVGKGSIFTIRLPLQSLPQTASTPA